MPIIMRMAVPESAEKVPFSQINFEEIHDEAGRVIQEVVPRWNVSSAELEKILNGNYTQPDLVDTNVPGEMQPFVELLQRTWKYVTSEEDRGTTGNVFETVEGKLRRRQAIYEYTSNYNLLMEFVRENPYHDLAQKVYYNARCPDTQWEATRESSYWLSYSVRKTMTGKFIVDLLGKLRHLLPKPEIVTLEAECAEEVSMEVDFAVEATAEAESPAQATPEAGSPAEATSELESPAEATVQVEPVGEATPEAEPAAETLVEQELPIRALESKTEPEHEPEPESYGPFESREEALVSLIQCLQLILHDHHCRGLEIDYKYDYRSGEEYDAPGNVEWASHWSQLYQYLRKDIEKNGPVPEELQFFFGHIELGARLERLTEREARVLFSIQDDRARSIMPAIQKARHFYGVNYESW